MRGSPVAILFSLLLVFTSSSLSPLTLYVRRTIVADPGVLTVGNLVQASGYVSRELKETLDRGVGELSDRLLIIPVGIYRDFFDTRGEENLILVGKRTLVAPRGTAAESALPLLDKLADYMESQGGIGKGRVEIEAVQISGAARTALSSGLEFQTIRAEKKGSLWSGAAEVGFRAVAGSPYTGRIGLRIVQDTALSGETTEAGRIKANDAVSVFFRKGAILVEMQGKALTGASLGETMDVYVPESRMSFSGVVIGNKAVSVEVQ